jgi:peptidoglycan/xylan/chitin deacetylase (PgdA/CDA1 family)
MSRLKAFALRLSFRSGALALYHRVRNRNALTVISLHRVIAAADPRWSTCDPLYTLSDRLFEQCCRFLAAHYSIVSLGDVARAYRSGEPLPPRPLLITFDDGWADNHRYALPILRKLGLPAALFVASDALDRHDAFFQERLIAAWRAGRLDRAALRGLWGRTGAAPPADVVCEDAVRALIARLRDVPVPERREILAPLAAALEDGERQMLTSGELRELAAAGFAVGTHGKTHEALTTVTDVDAELNESRAVVARAIGVAPERLNSLSFPFSKQNGAVVARARAAGYDLLFGGGLSLTPLPARQPDLIARVGITADEVSDAQGELRSDLLAAYLFRRPHKPLQAAA